MKKQTNIKTLKLRIKDKHSKVLNQMAFEVNQVWNAVNAETDELGWFPVPEVGYMSGGDLSAYDLQKQFKTIRKERGFIIPAVTTQEVIATHAKARKQFKKNKLKWRTSGGARRALGWVPFKIGSIKWIDGQIRFAGNFFGVWDSFGLSDFQLRSGSFSQDSRGRWYINIVVEVEVKQSTGKGQVGIDLGLKTTATCSNGEQLERHEYYRKSEEKLGIAQRANNKNRVKAIHAKIKNQRKDSTHKFTTKLVNNNELIVIGNVSSSGLAKTKMAKSVLDAGWFILKTQLDYKSKGMRVVFEEVNERYTTQTCSCCGCISCNSPKGRAGLEIREWECAECGTTHDRDINAAINILALGHERLAVGITAPLGR